MSEKQTFPKRLVITTRKQKFKKSQEKQENVNKEYVTYYVNTVV